MQLDTDYTHQNVKKENIKNHFCKRRRSQIEVDEEDEIDTSRKIAKWGIITISENQNTRWWRRFWRPSQVIMIKLPGLQKIYSVKSRVWALMIRLLIYLWVLRRIIKVISSEPEESIRNLTSLNEIFQIIPSQMDGNWPFHKLNNSVFRGQYSAEEIRNEICAFLIRKKNLYENLWEGDFDTHIRNMK